MCDFSKERQFTIDEIDFILERTVEIENTKFDTLDYIVTFICESIKCENCPVTIHGVDNRSVEDKCLYFETCQSQLWNWMKSEFEKESYIGRDGEKKMVCSPSDCLDKIATELGKESWDIEDKDICIPDTQTARDIIGNTKSYKPNQVITPMSEVDIKINTGE